MSETIITKACSKCKEIKSLDEFYKNRSRKSGYRTSCKQCDRSYWQSDKGKEVIRRYLQSDKGKKTGRRNIDRYQKTEKGKMGARRYHASDKGQATQKRINLAYHKNFPERRKANDAVNDAVKHRTMPKASSLFCKCGNRAQEYHHHLGYAPEHWLAVIPLCLVCHRSIHNK